jgi:uncharacterized membrane protein HdeD (DUF308 family)
MLNVLGRHWWVLALRGLLAVLFGVMAIVWPGTTVRVLVILFGIYALVDGLFELFSALATRPRGGGWWLLLLEAVAGIAAGVLAFIWPETTALVLLYLIAAWAILSGVLELIAAFQLRREVEGEWVLALAGAISVIVGLLLALRPVSGLVAVAWFVGGYAIVFGVLLILLGFRLRTLHRELV